MIPKEGGSDASFFIMHSVRLRMSVGVYYNKNDMEKYGRKESLALYEWEELLWIS